VLAVDEQAATTRLALQPLTGRTHQLRVHLAAIGYPILGDALYAPPLVQARASRLLLHAGELSLAHPLSGLPLQLRCEAPF
jgi:tRNA pseudouridine32 synthase/23S rRNA pseudouridine746 synthase